METYCTGAGDSDPSIPAIPDPAFGCVCVCIICTLAKEMKSMKMTTPGQRPEFVDSDGSIQGGNPKGIAEVKLDIGRSKVRLALFR